MHTNARHGISRLHSSLRHHGLVRNILQDGIAVHGLLKFVRHGHEVARLAQISLTLSHALAGAGSIEAHDVRAGLHEATARAEVGHLTLASIRR